MSIDDSTPIPFSVYFIQFGIDGPIKIGFTDGDVGRRRRILQIGCPYPLRVLAIIPTHSGALERELHSQFAACRIRGEWFEATPGLLQYIARKATPYKEETQAVRASLKRQARKSGVLLPSRRKFDGKRGRPANSTNREMRVRMVAAAVDWKVIGASVDRVAAYYGVHVNTIKNWTDQALSFKGCAGRRLRNMVQFTSQLHNLHLDPDDD